MSIVLNIFNFHGYPIEKQGGHVKTEKKMQRFPCPSQVLFHLHQMSNWTMTTLYINYKYFSLLSKEIPYPT